jgi:formate dehydrogenase (coenzyme F420) alpha subunit
MSSEYIVPTVCGMCGRYAVCGLNATVVDGKIVKVEGRKTHPLSQGFLCHVGQAALEYQYSDERLTHPLKKTDRGLQRISWEEALNIIVTRLETIKQDYGPQALAVYLGMVMTPMVKHAKRFCDLFGTPNITSAASFCMWSGIIAHTVTYGSFAMPDVSNSKLIVVWGNNPPKSNRLLNQGIEEAVGKGAKVVVIDPRETEIAHRAYHHIPIRPATDGALALALLNVIISEGLYNGEFVREYTSGFKQLKDMVRAWTPERVEKMTWVHAGTIRELARLIGKTSPMAIATGISMNHTTNGFQGFRAIATIIAITGNLDIKGGNTFGYRLPFNSYRVREKFPSIKGVGVSEYPSFFKVLREAHASCLSAAITQKEPHPIKALLVQGGNPVSSWPNTEKTLEALNRLDLLVVMDTYMTETAKLADIVLPAASFFERPEWIDYGQMTSSSPIVILQRKVVEPLEDCWPDWRFWFTLGRTMGYDEYYPWLDIEDAIDWELSPSGITFEQLAENPDGIDYEKVTYRKYKKNGFNTPSRKVEIYSERIDRLGQDPLPRFTESTETPVSRPDLVERYPFLLITGLRNGIYQHSQFRQCPSLQKIYPEPRAEINTETAMGLGIEDGDMVRVTSPRGSVKLRALVTDKIDPTAIGVEEGWADANANILTDDAHDPITGFPPFRAALCSVSKA